MGAAVGGERARRALDEILRGAADDAAAAVDLDALRERLQEHGAPDDAVSRAISWKLTLRYLPEDRSEWRTGLSAHRQQYLLVSAQIASHPADTAPDDDHPLSSREDSHWAQFFDRQETQRRVQLDVERTHPDRPAFRRLRPAMLRILLAFVAQNPKVGYRQGMNELLAPFVVVFDSAATACAARAAAADDERLACGGEADAEADAFFALCVVMKEMAACYDARSGRLEAELNELSVLLKLRDAPLEEHLERAGVSTRLYGLRWLRLWLTQEFDLEDVFRLWDSLLSTEPRLPWLRQLCVAMIIAVRERLLRYHTFQDIGGILMRYPKEAVSVEDLLHLARILRSGSVGVLGGAPYFSHAPSAVR